MTASTSGVARCVLVSCACSIVVRKMRRPVHRLADMCGGGTRTHRIYRQTTSGVRVGPSLGHGGPSDLVPVLALTRKGMAREAGEGIVLAVVGIEDREHT